MEVHAPVPTEPTEREADRHAVAPRQQQARTAQRQATQEIARRHDLRPPHVLHRGAERVELVGGGDRLDRHLGLTGGRRSSLPRLRRRAHERIAVDVGLIAALPWLLWILAAY